MTWPDSPGILPGVPAVPLPCREGLGEGFSMAAFAEGIVDSGFCPSPQPSPSGRGSRMDSGMFTAASWGTPFTLSHAAAASGVAASAASVARLIA